MAGLMSKRQQARNERALQDLVQTVAGNNTCADCGARNPFGYLPVHAMRRHPSQVGNSHFQSQVAEHGQLDE
ncbi:putative uba ts-n domain-containing protein [Rosellinia necatrix]|uniref:Putative uba ts-n domain-containing protein n=1 Tax=Rosellinia necatrix TaxID=77044 RepID=A0A1S8A798_ROSNE|nr:putative uba ts-n domain-containing protein [Rosellinia necatrix]